MGLIVLQQFIPMFRIMKRQYGRFYFVLFLLEVTIYVAGLLQVRPPDASEPLLLLFLLDYLLTKIFILFILGIRSNLHYQNCTKKIKIGFLFL
jgi:hypothetical protein